MCNLTDWQTKFFDVKQKVILFTLLIFSVNVCATQQTPDLLIIGNDTISLEVFPLEQLEMKYRPFGFGVQGKEFASTACWRSYRAIWKIVDNKLFLEKIIQCHNVLEEEDIVQLFEKNDIQYQKIDELIFTDWYTISLYKRKDDFYKNRTFLNNRWDRIIKRKKKIVLQIENGIVTRNEL